MNLRAKSKSFWRNTGETEVGGGLDRGAQSTLSPFLKWAGGKRWFVRHHAGLFPTTYNLSLIHI